VQGDQVIRFLDGNEPHPSVVWYRSSEKTVVGRIAKQNLGSRQSGVIGDFVRSPKFNLGKGHPVHVAGRNLAASDVVSEILAYLHNDVMREERRLKNISLERAVVTIPVTMHGPARQELREAAHKAGIRIHQFVHEPLAALYGYLRAYPNFRRRIAELENKVALVFDWGGGTLDLTLCKFVHGSLVQIANRGDTEVGGDRFDEAIADWVRESTESNILFRLVAKTLNWRKPGSSNSASSPRSSFPLRTVRSFSSAILCSALVRNIRSKWLLQRMIYSVLAIT
jgi:molecular chaperone DnaK (HSP70)